MLNVGVTRILHKNLLLSSKAEVNPDETVSRMALSARYSLITIYLSEVSGCHIMKTMLDKILQEVLS